MQISGTVKQILNTETIGNPPKQLTKKTIIVETPGKYPQNIAIDFLNKNIDILSQIKVGDNVDIKVNARSKEYNGKWYTNIMGWEILQAQASLETADQLPDSNDLPF